jgi:uncharacterized membrane protein
LRDYDAIQPGTAERIIAMAEKEQAQRHRIETSDLETTKRYEGRGQWFGFLVAITGIVVAGIVVGMGEPWGAAISFTALASLVGLFLSRGN